MSRTNAILILWPSAYSLIFFFRAKGLVLLSITARSAVPEISWNGEKNGNGRKMKAVCGVKIIKRNINHQIVSSGIKIKCVCWWHNSICIYQVKIQATHSFPLSRAHTHSSPTPWVIIISVCKWCVRPLIKVFTWRLMTNHSSPTLHQDFTVRIPLIYLRVQDGNKEWGGVSGWVVGRGHMNNSNTNKKWQMAWERAGRSVKRHSCVSSVQLRGDAVGFSTMDRDRVQ